MYFYVFEGQVYWGRHQNLPPHRSLYTWIFRSKPVRLNRMYLSGENSFIVIPTADDQRFGVLLSLPGLNNRADYQIFQIEEGRCYTATSDGFKECHATRIHYHSREEFRNMFRNRMRQYRGRYFLSIDKFTNYR